MCASILLLALPAVSAGIAISNHCLVILTSHLAQFFDKTLEQPALYLYGEYDKVAGNMPEAIAAMQAALPDLRRCVQYDGAGRWPQQ